MSEGAVEILIGFGGVWVGCCRCWSGEDGGVGVAKGVEAEAVGRHDCGVVGGEEEVEMVGDGEGMQYNDAVGGCGFGGE